MVRSWYTASFDLHDTSSGYCTTLNILDRAASQGKEVSFIQKVSDLINFLSCSTRYDLMMLFMHTSMWILFKPYILYSQLKSVPL